MELKLRSIWLLLSCSLQQSLVGILASVPQTNAKKCTERVSNDGERSTVKKVQMIRRIPARCSGWDEAWSWITKIDCRTKYVLDYIELPFDVKKTDEDCDPAEAQASESGVFNVTDERFLAIVFGSGALALLIIIIIIVIVVKRTRCSNACGRSADYTATATDNEEPPDQHVCNEYVDEGLKLVEPEYEEIRDPKAKAKHLYPSEQLHDTELKSLRYQNVPDPVSAQEACAMNGLFSRTVVPSAPYEEESHHQQTAVKDTDLSLVTDPESINGSTRDELSVVRCVTENGSETSVKVESAQKQTKVKEIDDLKSIDNEKSKDCAEKDDENKDKPVKSEETCPKTENLYSEFDSIVNSTKKNCDSASPKVAHSYENLNQDFVNQDLVNYESVTPNYESLNKGSGDVNCSVKNHVDAELKCEEIDSNVMMENLKEIGLESPVQSIGLESPIQSEDTC